MKFSSVEKVRQSFPEIVEMLEKEGVERLIEPISSYLAERTGAVSKFVNFLLEHSPPPPKDRPAPAFRLSYERKSLKKSFELVYRYRSKALHGGTAFPYPMCCPPSVAPSEDETPRFFEERPVGLGVWAYNASWQVKDMPMLLHTFEYIVRNAILRWWNTLCKKDK